MTLGEDVLLMETQLSGTYREEQVGAGTGTGTGGNPLICQALIGEEGRASDCWEE